MEEWLSKPKNSLHSGIKKLCQKLSQGDSVVLDDCNPTQKGRQSIIAAVKKQVPGVKIEGIEFRPNGGLFQSQLATEWASAATFENQENDRLHMSIDLSSDDSQDSDSDDDDERGGRQSNLDALLASDPLQKEKQRSSTLNVRYMRYLHNLQ